MKMPIAFVFCFMLASPAYSWVGEIAYVRAKILNIDSGAVEVVDLNKKRYRIPRSIILDSFQLKHVTWAKPVDIPVYLQNLDQIKREPSSDGTQAYYNMISKKLASAVERLK